MALLYFPQSSSKTDALGRHHIYLKASCIHETQTSISEAQPLFLLCSQYPAQ